MGDPVPGVAQDQTLRSRSSVSALGWRQAGRESVGESELVGVSRKDGPRVASHSPEPSTLKGFGTETPEIGPQRAELVSGCVSGSDQRVAVCVGGSREREGPATRPPSSRVPHTNSLTRRAGRHPLASPAGGPELPDKL